MGGNEQYRIAGLGGLSEKITVNSIRSEQTHPESLPFLALRDHAYRLFTERLDTLDLPMEGSW